MLFMVVLSPMGTCSEARILRDASVPRAPKSGYGYGYGYELQAAASPAAGIVNDTVVPLPGALSAQIRPPCASTIPLPIDSPSPMPSRLLRPACQARLNRLSSSS